MNQITMEEMWLLIQRLSPENQYFLAERILENNISASENLSSWGIEQLRAGVVKAQRSIDNGIGLDHAEVQANMRSYANKLLSEKKSLDHAS